MLSILCVLETFNYKCLIKFNQNFRVIKLNKCIKKNKWNNQKDKCWNRKSKYIYWQFLQIIQARILKVMTKVFRVTTKATLNVKIYMLSIKQRFEKLINDIMFRIVITSFYKHVINKKFNTQNRRITLLKTLIVKFKKHASIKARNIKKIESFVETSWWKFSNIWIFKNKKKNKTKHDVTRFNKKHNYQIIYRNENNINKKIKATVVNIDNNVFRFLNISTKRFKKFNIYHDQKRSSNCCSKNRLLNLFDDLSFELIDAIRHVHFVTKLFNLSSYQSIQIMK